MATTVTKKSNHKMIYAHQDNKGRLLDYFPIAKIQSGVTVTFLRYNQFTTINL